jgi:hypothetical protein
MSGEILITEGHSRTSPGLSRETIDITPNNESDDVIIDGPQTRLVSALGHAVDDSNLSLLAGYHKAETQRDIGHGYTPKPKQELLAEIISPLPPLPPPPSPPAYATKPQRPKLVRETSYYKRRNQDLSDQELRDQKLRETFSQDWGRERRAQRPELARQQYHHGRSDQDPNDQELGDQKLKETYTQHAGMKRRAQSPPERSAPVPYVEDYRESEWVAISGTRRNPDAHDHQSDFPPGEDHRNDSSMPDPIPATIDDEYANERSDHDGILFATGYGVIPRSPEWPMSAGDFPNDSLTHFAGEQLPSSQDGRSVFADDFDELDSDYAESIFSQDSIASTATSLGNSLGTTGIVEMVDRITSTIFCGDYLQDVNKAAVEDAGIGPERYRRNVRRMIKTFGKDLRNEADGPIERRTAVAMQTRRVSTHVAREIVSASHLEERRVVEEQEHTNECQQSDVSTESADEENDISSREPEDEAKIRNFILNSNACVNFKTRLLHFAHEPYEKRLLAALDAGSLGANRVCPRFDAPAVRVVQELSWAPTPLLSFSEDRSLHWADHVKDYVESSMGESWNWSPLAERRHRLKPDCCRLSWKLVSIYSMYVIHVRTKLMPDRSLAVAPGISTCRYMLKPQSRPLSTLPQRSSTTQRRAVPLRDRRMHSRRLDRATTPD